MEKKTKAPESMPVRVKFSDWSKGAKMIAKTAGTREEKVSHAKIYAAGIKVMQEKK